MIRRSRIENLIKRSGIIESDKEKWNRKADISNERETDIRNVRYTISGRA
jgi:hypothetical protein